MADETKIEEQVIAEPSTSVTGEPAPAPVTAPSTRRGLLRWIAPAVLFVGTTLKPATAQAADDFTGAPNAGRCTPRP